jgi:hypothetical protein
MTGRFPKDSTWDDIMVTLIGLALTVARPAPAMRTAKAVGLIIRSLELGRVEDNEGCVGTDG